MGKIAKSVTTAAMFLAIVVGTVIGREAMRGALRGATVDQRQVTLAPNYPNSGKPSESGWSSAAEAFEMDHPELKLGENYRIMQAELDHLPPTLKDDVLLSRALEAARHDPKWTRADGKPAPPPGYDYAQ